MESLYNNMKLKLIEIEDKHGSLFGTIMSTGDSSFKDLFLKNGFSNTQKILEEQEMYSKIIIIDNIFVDDDQRGKGIGNYLMNELFENLDNEVEALYLLADIYEKQENGFNLVKWYEDYGFEKIADTVQGPIMKMEVEK